MKTTMKQRRKNVKNIEITTPTTTNTKSITSTKNNMNNNNNNNNNDDDDDSQQMNHNNNIMKKKNNNNKRVNDNNIQYNNNNNNNSDKKSSSFYHIWYDWYEWIWLMFYAAYYSEDVNNNTNNQRTMKQKNNHHIIIYNRIIRPNTIQAVCILMFAIIISLIWNIYHPIEHIIHQQQHNKNVIHNNINNNNIQNQNQQQQRRTKEQQKMVKKYNNTNGPIGKLIDMICNYDYHHNMTKALSSLYYCHESLIPIEASRTQMTDNIIYKDDTILHIPNEITIWDLDAIYDTWIYNELILPLLSYDTLNNNHRIKDDNNYHNKSSSSRHTSSTYLPYASSSTTTTTNWRDISPAAYLAVYLARLINHLNNTTISINETTNSQTNNEYSLHPILIHYITNVLPTYDNYKSYHPLLWTENEMKQYIMKSSSSSFHHIRSIQDMIRYEYNTFISISSSFHIQISYEMYITSRLHVLTRNFGTGPTIMNHKNYHKMSSSTSTSSVPPPNNTDHPSFSLLVETIHNVGSYVMVPILDLYNHHGSNPNVDFYYSNNIMNDDNKDNDHFRSDHDNDNDERSAKESSKKYMHKHHHGDGFIVKANRNIISGIEIWDKYGKHTDCDLYAKYGFVNNDGSDYTEANIALYHSEYIQYHTIPHSFSKTQTTASPSDIPTNTITHVPPIGLKQQIIRYLQYDDGYESCIIQKSKNSWNFKVYKYHYLLYRARSYKHWVATFPPRNSSAVPFRTMQDSLQKNKDWRPPSFPHQQKQQQHRITQSSIDNLYHHQLKYVFSTCRVISLIESDYNHEALHMLQNNMYNMSYIFQNVPNTSLEFRTLLCMARIVRTIIVAKKKKTTTSASSNSMTTQSILQELYDEVTALYYNNNTQHFTISFLHLSEIQSLEYLQHIAFGQLYKQPIWITYMKQNQNSNDMPPIEYRMRNEPCPIETSLQPLLHSSLPVSSSS